MFELGQRDGRIMGSCDLPAGSAHAVAQWRLDEQRQPVAADGVDISGAVEETVESWVHQVRQGHCIGGDDR